MLREQGKLKNDDNDADFVQNATIMVETMYPNVNKKVDIEASSCHLAGHLMCTYLMKMLFTIYNVDPLPDAINDYRITSS